MKCQFNIAAHGAFLVEFLYKILEKKINALAGQFTKSDLNSEKY